jgi:hypothetical protein
MQRTHTHTHAPLFFKTSEAYFNYLACADVFILQNKIRYKKWDKSLEYKVNVLNSDMLKTLLSHMPQPQRLSLYIA